MEPETTSAIERRPTLHVRPIGGGECLVQLTRSWEATNETLAELLHNILDSQLDGPLPVMELGGPPPPPRSVDLPAVVPAPLAPPPVEPGPAPVAMVQPESSGPPIPEDPPPVTARPTRVREEPPPIVPVAPPATRRVAPHLQAALDVAEANRAHPPLPKAAPALAPDPTPAKPQLSTSEAFYVAVGENMGRPVTTGELVQKMWRAGWGSYPDDMKAARDCVRRCIEKMPSAGVLVKGDTRARTYTFLNRPPMRIDPS